MIAKWKFPHFTDAFVNDLNKEFNNSFSVKTAEAADLIVNSIDQWYIENKLGIPEKGMLAAIDSEHGITDRNYFAYDEIVWNESSGQKGI